MVDMSVFTSMLWTWMRSGLFWGVAVFIFLVLGIGSLWARKWKKLCIPLIEIFDLGNGKMAFEAGKCGYFKAKSLLFGLYDYGAEEYLKHKDGRIIRYASTIDFHEINGKSGIICLRKDDDVKVLVPLTKLEVKNLDIIATIAPADYRDTSSQIIQDAKDETMDWIDKYLPYIIIGGVIVFAFVALIMISQMIKNGQAEATKLILEAGEMRFQECSQIMKGTSP